MSEELLREALALFQSIAGFSSATTRCDWYERMHPVRDRIAAYLSAPASPPVGEPHYWDGDGYRCEPGVKPRFVLKEDHDALRSALAEAQGRIEGIAILNSGHQRLAVEYRERAESAERELDLERERGRDMGRELLAAESRAASADAEVDRIMLEFCPDEMTTEQRERWERHQRPVDALSNPSGDGR